LWGLMVALCWAALPNNYLFLAESPEAL
jgi:hypothetical protein